MRIVLIFLVSVALAVPAAAQGMGGRGGRGKPPRTEQGVEKKKKSAAEEKAYRSAIEKLPEKKFDPWRTAR